MHTFFPVTCTFFSLGTNEEAIIKIVAHRTNEQRQLIRNKFKALYRKVQYLCLWHYTLLETTTIYLLVWIVIIEWFYKEKNPQI